MAEDKPVTQDRVEGYFKELGVDAIWITPPVEQVHGSTDEGSGKSYAMIFFVEKVRRVVPGNFTFVVMTDRDDLDGQIYKSDRIRIKKGNDENSTQIVDYGQRGQENL